MNKQVRKLLNDVTHILKVCEEGGYIPTDKTTVKYDFKWRDDSTHCRAFIMLSTENYSTGNGYERTYGYQLLEKLVEVSNKYNISFHIGLTENIEMHIQVYVN